MSEPEIPADIKPSKRTTKLMREQQNHRIIGYIQGGATDQAIMSGLKLTRRTFERRMKQIRQMHMNESTRPATSTSQSILTQTMPRQNTFS